MPAPVTSPRAASIEYVTFARRPQGGHILHTAAPDRRDDRRHVGRKFDLERRGGHIPETPRAAVSPPGRGDCDQAQRTTGQPVRRPPTAEDPRPLEPMIRDC